MCALDTFQDLHRYYQDSPRVYRTAARDRYTETDHTETREAGILREPLPRSLTPIICSLPLLSQHDAPSKGPIHMLKGTINPLYHINF